MTTATTTPTTTAPAEATPLPPPSGGGTAGAIAAEWTKLWSVRSTWWCLLAAAGLMVLGTASMGASFASGVAGSGLDEQLPLGQAALVGVQGAQFAVIAWAMLVITAEYSTGSIRTTLQGVPQRSRIVLAKAAVVVAATLAVGLLLGGVGAFAASVTLGENAAVDASSLTADVLTVGLYTALVSAFTLGVGLVVRSAVGTLVTVFFLLLVLPNLLASSSIALLAWAADYLPGGAAMHLLAGPGEPYGPAFAAVLLAGWAVAGLLGGLGLLRRRDA